MRQYFTSAERSEALERAAPPRQDLPKVDYSCMASTNANTITPGVATGAKD